MQPGNDGVLLAQDTSPSAGPDRPRPVHGDPAGRRGAMSDEGEAAPTLCAEWGSRLALHNSQPGADAAAHAPVPRWGWGEAPPYRP